jgi:histone H3
MELNTFKAEIENIEKIAKDHEELVSEEFDAVHPDDLMETESEDGDSDRGADDSDEELDETGSEDSEADEAEADIEIAEDSDDGLCDAKDDGDAADDDEEADEADETETGASAVTGATGTEDAFNLDETTSRRKRRKGAAISEIRRVQAKTDYLIPFMNFNRLVREIASDYKTDLRFTKNAILALQTAAESNMIGLFTTSQLMAIHAGRQGIEPRDMTLALRAMDPDCGGI